MRKAKSSVIEIKEEVQVGGIILEKGDRILVEDRRVSTFSIANDTKDWVLIVDGFFQRFPTKAMMNKVASLIKEDSFEDSPFGSMNILPPHYTPEFISDSYVVTSQISEEVGIDLENYIVKQYQKRRNYSSPKLSRVQQYQQDKAFSSLFYKKD